jgi:hypothetical protein
MSEVFASLGLQDSKIMANVDDLVEGRRFNRSFAQAEG